MKNKHKIQIMLLIMYTLFVVGLTILFIPNVVLIISEIILYLIFILYYYRLCS